MRRMLRADSGGKKDQPERGQNHRRLVKGSLEERRKLPRWKAAATARTPQGIQAVFVVTVRPPPWRWSEPMRSSSGSAKRSGRGRLESSGGDLPHSPCI